MRVEKMLSLSRETGAAITSFKELTGSTDGQLAGALEVPEGTLKKAERGKAEMGDTERIAQKLASLIRASKGQRLGATKQRPEERKSLKESATDSRGRNPFTGVKRKKSNPYQSLGQDSGEADGRAERRADGTRTKPRFTESF